MVVIEDAKFCPFLGGKTSPVPCFSCSSPLLCGTVSGRISSSPSTTALSPPRGVGCSVFLTPHTHLFRMISLVFRVSLFCLLGVGSIPSVCTIPRTLCTLPTLVPLITPASQTRFSIIRGHKKISSAPSSKRRPLGLQSLLRPMPVSFVVMPRPFRAARGFIVSRFYHIQGERSKARQSFSYLIFLLILGDDRTAHSINLRPYLGQRIKLEFLAEGKLYSYSLS